MDDDIEKLVFMQVSENSNSSDSGLAYNNFSIRSRFFQGKFNIEGLPKINFTKKLGLNIDDYVKSLNIDDYVRL